MTLFLADVTWLWQCHFHIKNLGAELGEYIENIFLYFYASMNQYNILFFFHDSLLLIDSISLISSIRSFDWSVSDLLVNPIIIWIETILTRLVLFSTSILSSMKSTKFWVLKFVLKSFYKSPNLDHKFSFRIDCINWLVVWAKAWSSESIPGIWSILFALLIKEALQIFPISGFPDARLLKLNS